MMRSNLEEGVLIPFFNPEHGYYSISFTPCSYGNRIYVHHHLTNNSHAILDMASTTVINDDASLDIQSKIDEEDKMIEDLNNKLNQHSEEFPEVEDIDLVELNQ